MHNLHGKMLRRIQIEVKFIDFEVFPFNFDGYTVIIYSVDIRYQY